MANEANSRHTTPFPRWGETTAQVPNASNVSEPSGGKKDVGWVPGGEGITGQWWNWLHWAAGVFFRYIENALLLAYPDNHVMAGAPDTEGVVSNGAGLTVNVTAARVWLDGQMHKVPAATNLALAVADPTDARVDLVYAHLVALAPVYAVVTGTPSATLPLPVPAVPAGGVALYTVQVNAAGATPGSKVDVREFGAFTVDRITGRKKLYVGEVSSTPVFEVNSDTSLISGVIIGDPTDPLLVGNVFLDQLYLSADRVQFIEVVTRQLDLPGSAFNASGFVDDPNSIGAPINGAYSNTTGGGWQGDADDAANVVAPVQLPDGVTITRVRAYGNRVDDARGLSFDLYARVKATGSPTSVATKSNNIGSGATGDFTLSDPVSVVVDQGNYYELSVTWIGHGQCKLRGAEIEYTESKPWQSV